MDQATTGAAGCDVYAAKFGRKSWRCSAEGTRPEEIDEARAQLEEAHQAWLLRKNGYRAEEIAQAKAAVEAAQAALEGIDRQIDELTVVAPLDAVVEAVDLQPGDLVSAERARSCR